MLYSCLDSMFCIDSGFGISCLGFSTLPQGHLHIDARRRLLWLNLTLICVLNTAFRVIHASKEISMMMMMMLYLVSSLAFQITFILNKFRVHITPFGHI